MKNAMTLSSYVMRLKAFDFEREKSHTIDFPFSRYYSENILALKA
jgi:hypothetical protein